MESVRQAIELKAAMELGEQQQCRTNETRKITSQDGRPVDCAGVEGCLSGTSCRLVFEHEKRDYQKMICIGGLNKCESRIREIFREQYDFRQRASLWA